MWEKISDWIHVVSTSWVSFFTLVIFWLFIVLVLPNQASETEVDMGSVGSPDMSFYYTVDELYQMAKAYGDEGRQAYVKVRFTFDLIWPLIYTIFLCTGISWVYFRAFTRGTMWQRANIVPVWGALFDYLENVSTTVVMIRYPSPTAVLDMLAPVFTLVKWVFVGGSFVLLLIGLLVGSVQWLTMRFDGA